MRDDWKRSLPYLREAREELTKAIERLEKAAKELREFMDANRTAAENPARQKHLDSIGKLILNAQAERDEIEHLIEDLEKTA